MQADHQTRLLQFYDNLDEPLKGTLLFLRETILQQDQRLLESWKYSMPFFTVGKKMFCYFWFDKNNQSKPYIGFADGYRMEHPFLETGNRKRMKIFRVDPAGDIPLKELKKIIIQALSFY